MLECFESLVCWWWLWSRTVTQMRKDVAGAINSPLTPPSPAPPFPQRWCSRGKSLSLHKVPPCLHLSASGMCGAWWGGAPIATFAHIAPGAGGWMSTSLYPFGRRDSPETCSVQALVVPQKDGNSVANSSNLLVSRPFIGFPPFIVSLSTSFCASVIASE